MKIAALVLSSAMAALVILCGCQQKHAQTDDSADEHHNHDHPAEEGVTFKEGKGLHVPPETAQFIGLLIEEVGEKAIGSSINFNGHVYQHSSAGKGNDREALASGYISASNAALLKAGQEAKINSSSDGGFEGQVLRIDSNGKTNSSRVEVLVGIKDPEGKLTVGSLINATLSLSKEKNGTVVPQEAILRTAEGNFVYTLSGDRFVRAPVKVGGRDASHVQITDGLYAGDQVVVRPVMTLWLAELQSIRGGQACADGH